jgi:hypothetical protein
MARFARKFREILCFIKGEAAKRLDWPSRQVSHEARVTNEVDVV